MQFKMCRRFTDNMRTFNRLMKRVGKMFLVLLTLIKLLVAFNSLLATILTLHSLKKSQTFVASCQVFLAPKSISRHFKVLSVETYLQGKKKHHNFNNNNLNTVHLF